jgi:hypothetical protein
MTSQNALQSTISCLGRVKRPPKTSFSLVKRTFPTGSLCNEQMKKISDPVEIRQSLTRCAYKNNINMVTEWHNKLFIGINEGLAELEELLEKSQEKDQIGNIKSSIHYYENYMSDNLRNFTLIMHLSNFEEISTLICKEMKVPIEKGSSIDRFKKGWAKKLRKPLGDVTAWTTLKDAEKIRHAILHSAGRISLNRNPEEIKGIIKKENLKENQDRIYATGPYLNKVKDAIWEMVQ